MGRLSRYLDLTNPIPEFQSSPPVMPPQVAGISGAVKPTYHGAWIYTDSAHRGLHHAQATPFTPRTNPFQYEGLTGPAFWQLDSTLSKNFPLTERFKLELRLEGYNLANSVMPGNPNLSVTSTQFGGITSQVNYGREVQYTLRLRS